MAPGAAHAAAGALDWIQVLVDRLRRAGVARISVRLDKGFFSAALVALLQCLRVDFVLKVPNHALVRHALGPCRLRQGDGLLDGLWHPLRRGAALRSVEHRTPLVAGPDALALATLQRTHVAHVLTNREDGHALTAWRTYHAGTLV